MKLAKHHLKVLPLAVAMATASQVTTVSAQENSIALEEIVVTATKRQTTLQETPVAVSVVSSDQIEKARINDIADLQSIVPSLRVNTLQTSTNTNFTIRGFGNGANNPGIESSVGLFVDGVYRSRSAARIGDLPKLERVEVLRGPQSTLFGKNASAGVISVVSAKPQFEQEGYVEAGIGNYNEVTGKAYYTNGLNDIAAFSIGGNFNKRDGYNEAVMQSLEDVNDRDRSSVQAQLLLTPNENAEIRFIADYAELSEICCGIVNIQNDGAANVIRAMGGMLPDENDPWAYMSYLNSNPTNDLTDSGVSMNVDLTFGNHTLTSISAMRKNESSFDFDADFNSLDLIRTGTESDISTFSQELRITSDYEGKFNWMLGGMYYHDAVDFKENVGWGAHTRPYINNLFNALAGNPAASALLYAAEAATGHAPNTFFGDGNVISEQWTLDNDSISIYGTVDFNVTDKLTLTAGLNYTDDEKKVTGSQDMGDPFFAIDFTNPVIAQNVAGGAIMQAVDNPNDPLYQAFGATFAQAGLSLDAATYAALNGGLLPAPVLAGYQQFVAGVTAQYAGPIAGLQALQFTPPMLGLPNGVEDGMSHDDKLTYTLRANFEVNDNMSVYVSAATGFKATSWNLSRASAPFHSDGAALEAAGLLPPNYIYNADPAMSKSFGTRYASPEESTVYEIGMKTSFERGALNLTLFDQSIEGFQSNLFQGSGFVLANAGEQSTWGIELDGMFAVTENLIVSGAMTHLNPKFDSFPGAPGPGGTVVDLTGETPAGIPRWAFSTAVNYSFDGLFGTDSFVRMDWQYESEVDMVDNILFSTGPYQPVRKVNTINASYGMEWDNGWQMTLWARNLTNDEYLSSAFPGVLQEGVIGAYTNQPRTYGMQVRKNF